jgi:hypothetical protein
MNEDSLPIPYDATKARPDDDTEQPLDVDAERARILAVAIKKAEIGAVEPKIAFSKDRRRRLVMYLAEGCTISEAAARIGISAVHIHHLKKTDLALAEAIATAREIGADRVLGRVQAIALTGAPDRMATIKAQELYLKGAHPEYRDNRGASATIEKRDADGSTYRITARSNSIPD